MADDTVDFLIRRIHAAERALVLAVTGGASEAISRLLTVPGASKTVLEAVVPYCESALARFLGGPPDKACSEVTARAMAMAAYRRACEYAGEHTNVAGIACTASLASDRPKRGAHRLHAALQTGTTTSVVSVELIKGQRTRDAEEQLAANVVLNLVAEACGVAERLPLDLETGESFERHDKVAPTAWQQLLAGKMERLAATSITDDTKSPLALFPGAFNPLHAGHRQMAAVAQQMLGVWPAFEICVVNVDKPPLDYLEMEHRIAQFGNDDSVWLTRSATFVEKARLFPGTTFLVGVDTLERIAELKYYGNDPAKFEQAIATIASHGCQFLVFGRLTDDRFQTLADLSLPAELAKLCREVPEGLFRLDVSSTALRGASNE